MKVKINEEKCIGCGQCESICSDVFKIGDDGLAQVVGIATPELLEDIEMAKSGCPTDAIEIEENA